MLTQIDIHTVTHSRSVRRTVWIGWFGIVSRQEQEMFSKTVRNGSGVAQRPVEWVLGSFPEVKGRDILLTTHLHLALRLRMIGTIPYGMHGDNFAVICTVTHLVTHVHLHFHSATLSPNTLKKQSMGCYHHLLCSEAAATTHSG